MTVQAAVGTGVLGAVVGAGAVQEGTTGSPSGGVLAATGHGLVKQAAQSLPITGSSNIVLLSSVAFITIVIGLLLVGLARRHRLAPDGIAVGPG